MRLIFKALLVLACLIPTLPAAGADYSEARFIRIQRNENLEPVALQTAVAKYVPASIEHAMVQADQGKFASDKQLRKIFGRAL